VEIDGIEGDQVRMARTPDATNFRLI